MLFSVQSELRPPHAIVTLAGDLDLLARPALMRRLRDAADRSCQYLTVDAGSVEFVDCGALRMLDDERRRLVDIGGGLVVAPASYWFRRVCELAEFSALLDPCPSWPDDGAALDPRRVTGC